MKKFALGFLLLLMIVFMLFLKNRLSLLNGLDGYKYHSASGISYMAKVQGKDFFVYDSLGTWSKRFVAGVNLGSAAPGYFPGEFPLTQEDYLRWFGYISGMNVNTIRVYTAQMPAFYRALEEFNKEAKYPIYLMQGVSLNEADIEKSRDAYAMGGKIKKDFLQTIRDTVDIIHGNATLKKESGHAGGMYAADVSSYVTGWILGMEWDPIFVKTTNQNNPRYTSYVGKYVTTPQGVSAFEVMLAEAADTAIAYETEHYQEQRPVAMVNWVTTDPLLPLGEPTPQRQDAVSLDMENLIAKPGFEAGFFASYHIYPYDSDVLDDGKKYMDAGNGNPYQSYLREINAHHTMPVLVSEVGVPASRGIAHQDMELGYNQGHLTEKEQGELLSALIGDIYEQECMGAVVFSWQDEWFKASWNTKTFDEPQRRPYWMDAQTNEQSFGLLAFEPGSQQSVCYVDGDTREWRQEHVIVQGEKAALSMMSDEKFLYLMLETPDVESQTLELPIDVIPEQGNTFYFGRQLSFGADFLLRLQGKEESKILVDPYYNATYYQFAVLGSALKRDPLYERKSTGQFVPIELMLSRPWIDPAIGEAVPIQTCDTGKLQYGVANPSAEAYDSLADFCYDGTNRVEIRLPWLLLNVRDPSTGRIMGDFYENEGIVSQPATPLQIALPRFAGDDSWQVGTYDWARWDMPTSHERLKASYFTLQSFLGKMDLRLRAKTPFERMWAAWNEISFSDEANWFRVQPFLNYFLVISALLLAYFFFVLLYIHGTTALRNRRDERTRNLLCAAVCAPLPHRGEGSKATAGRRLPGMRRPFTPANLVILNDLMTTLPPEEQERLIALINAAGFQKVAAKYLMSRDEEKSILAARLLGAMRSAELNGQILTQLYAKPSHIDWQYQGMLTLALTGDDKNLAHICTDAHFRQQLSFRSLQEIIGAYTGDKLALYTQLLESPDRFIVRICVKRIGQEHLTQLVEPMVSFLESSDYNLVIDAARSLGKIRWKPAAKRLCQLLTHEKWEVRAVAVTTLAAIDSEQFAPNIANMLHDREWQVRYNAAMALCETTNMPQVMADVESSGDRYAMEILQYATTMQNV